ncbi:MAG: HNH/ENDO VII family nuclease [Lachnospiraceae bacterium]|nr:HNH/ENDO VII family nuclease [Lachnospiraceae bacterium]
MPLYSRAQLSKSEKAQVERLYNENNQQIDPNTKKPLQEGKIDLGHKYGYEEKVMQMCAKRCGLTQREYHKMMKNPKLYQWEDTHENRTHKHECKNFKEQIHNCMKVIREYKNSENGKNLEPSRERNAMKAKSTQSSRTIKGFSTKSYSGKATAGKFGKSTGNFHGKSSSLGRSSSSSGKGLGSSNSGSFGGKGGIGGSSSGNSGGKGGIGGSAGGSSGGKGGSSSGGSAGGKGK